MWGKQVELATSKDRCRGLEEGIDLFRSLTYPSFGMCITKSIQLLTHMTFISLINSVI